MTGEKLEGQMRIKKLFGVGTLATVVFALGLQCSHGLVISGYVWSDTGAGAAYGNGIQDNLGGTEFGVSGVAVRAYLSQGGSRVELNGFFDQTITDNNGHFNIENTTTSFLLHQDYGYKLQLVFQRPDGSEFTVYGNGHSEVPPFSETADSDVDWTTYGAQTVAGSSLTWGQTRNISVAPDGILDISVGLVPVPEPANAALAVFGALAVGITVYRRIRFSKAPAFC
jgi:hypothetical protein